MKLGPLRLSVAINGAKLNLICLPQKPAADLASAPKLCFQNISGRHKKRKKKNDEPVFRTSRTSQGHLGMAVFLTPCRLT